MIIPKAVGAYKLTHQKSGLFYLGSATNIYERYHVHLSTLKSNTHKNPRLQAAFNDDPVFTLEWYETKDRDEAYNVEQMYIDRHFGKPDCANMHNSARSSWKPGTMPEQAIARFQRAAVEANLNRDYAKGWNHTEETKEKIRQGQLARDPSTFARGHKYSEETKARMRVLNSRPRAKGRKFSDEHRANMSAAQKDLDRVSNVKISIAGKIYKTIAEAAVALGVSWSTIRNRLKDDRYTDYVRL